MAGELEGELEEPRPRWKYAWMKPILGWRTAKVGSERASAAEGLVPEALGQVHVPLRGYGTLPCTCVISHRRSPKEFVVLAVGTGQRAAFGSKMLRCSQILEGYSHLQSWNSTRLFEDGDRSRGRPRWAKGSQATAFGDSALYFSESGP